MNDVTIFHVMRLITYWCSPVVFFVGVLLILYGNYKKIEQTLGRNRRYKKENNPCLRKQYFYFPRMVVAKTYYSWVDLYGFCINYVFSPKIAL